MSKYLRSGTFSELSVLSGPVENPFTFDENIEFYQNNGISLVNIGEITGDYNGGVLAPNGKIYGIPDGETSTILEIDPSDPGSAKPIPIPSYTSGGWGGGVLAPNGKIHGIPNGTNTILEIDPSDPEDAATLIPI